MCRGCWGYAARQSHYDIGVTSDKVTKKTRKKDGTVGLYANQDIGKNIYACWVERPAIVALDTPRLKDYCYHCHETASSFGGILFTKRIEEDATEFALRPCSDCGVVKFCSSVCETTANDSYHKLECPIFQTRLPRILSNKLRALLRLLLMREARQVTDSTWTSLDKITSQTQKFRSAGGQRWEDICSIAQCVLEYSDTKETFETVLGLCCKFVFYAFPLQDNFQNVIGIGMHPLFCAIRHSCKPNAYLQQELGHAHHSKGLRLRPLRRLSDGEELTISYVEPWLPYFIRKRLLKQNYFIDCKCPGCVLDVVDIKIENGKQMSPGRSADSDERYVTYQKAVKLVHQAAEDISISGPIAKLRGAVRILLDAGWETYESPVRPILHQLIHAYVKDSQHNLAFAYATILQLNADDDNPDTDSDHPTRLLYACQAVKLCRDVMDATDWACQRFDLMPRGLDLEFFARHVVRSTAASTSKMAVSHVTRWAELLNGVVRGYRPNDGAILNNEENENKVLSAFYDLGDDILTSIKELRGDIRE